MKIWDISIRQPVFMTMILAAGIIMGVFSYFRMPVDVYPDVEFPVVAVITIYPGAGPTEVEEQVTKKLEAELSTIGGVDTVNSTSAESVSTIVILFDLNQSADKVSQEVREKVNLLRNDLPSGIQEPVIRRFNPSDQAIMLFGVADKTGKLSPVELRQLVEDTIQAPLQRVPDVAAVDVAGGLEREIQVNLNIEAMQARKISPQQVGAALQTENINIPGGSLVESEQEVTLRTPGNFQTIDDLRNVIIANRGTPIYLRDIADVVDGYKKRESLSRLNGQESIVVSIRKQSGSNTVAVVDGVKRELEPIIAANPDLDIVIASDQAVQVSESIDGAVEDLLWGSLLAALVVFVFFRDFRSTIVTIAGLPVIMIATLYFMHLSNIGLNNISLLALALVVGLVIDDAIVVRENILRWLNKGYKPIEAASHGTAEVFLPVLATTATVMAVFLPVAYAQGIIGRFFVAFGFTVCIAMAISFFESLTMAPMLSAYFFNAKDTEDREISDKDDHEHAEADSWLNRFYGGFLNWALRFKWLTLLITTIIVVVSLYGATFLDFAFIPSVDQHETTMAVRLPAGTPIDVSQQEALKIENVLRQHPGVADIFTTIGATGAPEQLSFFLRIHQDYTTRTVIDELRRPLANAPGLSFTLGGGPGGATTDVVVEIRGLENVSYAALGQQAESVLAQLRTIPGLVDFDLSYKAGRPELQFVVEREKAAQLGLSTAQIGSTLRTLINGDTVTTFRGEGNEADIRVQLREDSRTSVDDILNLSFLTPSGAQIPLRQVATTAFTTGPNQISRIDRQPTINITANVAGRKVPGATTDVANLLATITPPAGITVSLGGSAEQQTQGFQDLGLAMLLSIVFIYMVLASQFNSFIQPILIMLALPLAIIGALLALLVTGFPLDLTAFIGFIMLMGLVTKNSILLVDFANREREKGIDANEAMRRAGPIRLRPILMTSLSLILAMIPVALGLSAGGEFRQAMAIAIMGGMITSTLLTLVVVPVAYGMVVGFLDRSSARRRARREAKDAAKRAARHAATPTTPSLTPALVTTSDAPSQPVVRQESVIGANGNAHAPTPETVSASGHQPAPATPVQPLTGKPIVAAQPQAKPTNEGTAAPKEFQLKPDAQTSTPPELTLRQQDGDKSVYDLKPEE
ncbi:MAG: efflux RND transporter permease subunit [Caldilineaceae bacterium]|nr:efflux RND transporter permease subunit [Caldilineaceae bacterium]